MSRAWYLKSYCDGWLSPEHFELKEIKLEPLEEGFVHVKNTWLSVDPYMRERMRNRKSYLPPFELDAPLTGSALGYVVASKSPDFTVGDRVRHTLGWREEAVVPTSMLDKIETSEIPDPHWLGLLHATGATAYFGLLKVAQARAGDVVFVSAAAGAVGSSVVQIAKASGMTVVASAGGSVKCERLKEIGADVVIDYKAAGVLLDKLRAATPNGIDVYFDNVGGEHLDAALAVANKGARFALCGMINSYNSSESTEMYHLLEAVKRSLTLKGFLLTDYTEHMGEFRHFMSQWMRNGAVVSLYTEYEGLPSMVDAFLGLFFGENVGKMLVRL